MIKMVAPEVSPPWDQTWESWTRSLKKEHWGRWGLPQLLQTVTLSVLLYHGLGCHPPTCLERRNNHNLLSSSGNNASQSYITLIQNVNREILDLCESFVDININSSSSISLEVVYNHDYHDHQFKSSSGGEGGGHNASSQLEMFLLERAKALHTSSGAPMHLNGGSGSPPNPFGAPNNPFLGHPGFPGIRSGLFPGSKTDKEFNNHDY